MHVETCQYRPAGNRTVHAVRDRRFKDMNAYPKNDRLRTIKEIMDLRRDGLQDVYKLRFVYTYRNRSTGRRVATKRSGWFYVAGTIVSKKDALDQFAFAPDMCTHIAGFTTEQVFTCHYEVEPVSSQSNYEYLSFVAPKKLTVTV